MSPSRRSDRKAAPTSRVADVAETRRRITDAALELHSSVGPSRTTVSEIARRAGVDRVTVYRHFPDDASLFRACSTEFAAQHPLPSVSTWTRSDDLEQRLRVALRSTYDYYADHETLLAHITRDAESIPALKEVGRHRRDWLKEVEGYIAGTSVRSSIGRDAIALAVDFRTWQFLVRRREAPSARAIDVVVAMVLAVTTGVGR